MVKHIYDKFQNWYHGGSILFISDPHFADEEMKYLRKNYIGDDEQVKRINSKVGKNDTLVILGDIGDVSYVTKLKGYKVLIMGNHDSGASNYKRVVTREINSDICPVCGNKVVYDAYTYHNCGIGYAWCPNCEDTVKPKADVFHDNKLFDEVYEGPLFISDKILLSHEPINFPYALNIHGHNHSGEFLSDANHINVCAECIDYTPVNLKHIIEKGVLKNIDTIHRITIDEATERKKKRQ